MDINNNSTFTIKFYFDKNGKSDIVDLLNDLQQKSISNKNARVQFRQITLFIELLSKNGTNLPENITKHIDGDIWELRPRKNRVLYFFFKDNKYILLHHFVKKTQKTPKKEILKAIKEIKDYNNNHQ